MSLNASQLDLSEEEKLEKNRTTGKDNKKCSACGGPLVFDPATQKMLCEFCGTAFEIPAELDEDEMATQNKQQQAAATAAGAAAAGATANAAKAAGAMPAKRNRHGERPLSEADAKAHCDWGAQKKMVTCKTCGAQTIYDAAQTTSSCPYCDSNQILEEPDKNDNMSPTGICVFKVDKDKARKLFQEWVSSLWFAPNDLKHRASAEGIDGVYLPHWTFDTEAIADYVIEYGIDETEKVNGEETTTTRWYTDRGRHRKFFDDFLMPACKKDNEHLLSDLAPFDTNDYQDYKPEYMAGYAAEKYTVTVHDAWKEAQKRMSSNLDEEICDLVRDKHHADHTRTKELNVQYSEAMFKYLFLPIWLSSFRYNGKVYQFMINGQTGKVSGDRPYSGWKLFFLFLVIAIILWLLLSRESPEDGESAMMSIGIHYIFG